LILSIKFGYLNKFASKDVISRAENTRWRTDLKLKNGIVEKDLPDWIAF
jgi:hypothetical protein